MKSTTLNNHTHRTPIYNCTHAQAWVLGWAITRWSPYNLLYWFRPPILESVAIIPIDREAVDPNDKFEPYMFRADGTFVDTPLNHYLRLRRRGADYDFFVNAGYLLNQFLLGPRVGYAALKEMLNLAEEDYATSGAPKDGTSTIQEEGASN